MEEKNDGRTRKRIPGVGLAIMCNGIGLALVIFW